MHILTPGPDYIVNHWILLLHSVRYYISQSLSRSPSPHAAPPSPPLLARSLISFLSTFTQKLDLASEPATALVKGPSQDQQTHRFTRTPISVRQAVREIVTDSWTGMLHLNHSTEPSTKRPSKQAIDPCTSKLANQVSTIQATRDRLVCLSFLCLSQPKSTFFSSLHLRALATSRADYLHLHLHLDQKLLPSHLLLLLSFHSINLLKGAQGIVSLTSIAWLLASFISWAYDSKHLSNDGRQF